MNIIIESNLCQQLQKEHDKILVHLIVKKIPLKSSGMILLKLRFQQLFHQLKAISERKVFTTIMEYCNSTQKSCYFVEEYNYKLMI